jgi:dTDP-4-dehydrorhamnose reductase
MTAAGAKSLTWITGSGGLIGNYLLRAATELAPARHVVGLTRGTLDLTDEIEVLKRFRREQPDLIIHCAALARSPDCQRNPSLARQVNVQVTRLLADLAAGIDFVFFTTDLAFDGTKGWYKESDPVNPLSVYAETKVMAEQRILRNPRHLVIRTSLNGGISLTGNRAFNEELRRAWESRKTSRLFIDEFRSPIPAIETARITWRLVDHCASGLFHVAGKERLSRWEIGELLARRWPELNPKIERASIKDYEGAPRSPDTSLDSSKTEDLLRCTLPSFSNWLDAQPPRSF